MGVEKVVKTPLTESSGLAAAASKEARQKLSIEFAKSAPEFSRQKILLAAKLAKLELTVLPDASSFSSDSARTCVLHTGEGPITQSYAVLRYLAALAPQTELYGATSYDQGAVDSWLEFCVLEIEVAVIASDKKGMKAAATADVEKACAALHTHLARRTFLAGERTTVADVAIYCALKAAFPKLFSSKTLVASYNHLVRWYLTCAAAVGEEDTFFSLPKTKAAAAEKKDARSGTRPPASNGAAVTTATKHPSEMFTPSFSRSRTRVKDVGASSVGSKVTVKGWVRSIREAERGATCFVQINDGSCLDTIQIVASKASTENFDMLKSSGGTGASIEAVGEIVESMGKGQAVEVRASSVVVLGRNMEVKSYPLSKKFHSVDHLRTYAHLRPRSRVGSAVVRVRHALAFATHEFFNNLGFLYIHTPLITAADCEGAGEQFTVTTLLPDEGEKGAKVPTTPDGAVDFTKDFFGKRTGLTVSGQLNVETHAVSLADCYTFGPTFRAENSHTSRHLAEFWMVEPELSFATLEDDINLAQDYLKYCVAAVLARCDEDLAFFESVNEKGLRQRLRALVETPFKVLDYADAIDILVKAMADGHKFENTDVSWGVDLNSEHERYLTDVVFEGPVVLVNYPQDIKAFYMKANTVTDPKRKTVAAMDILVPKIGEIIGGSQREDDLDKLEKRAADFGIDPKSIWWYTDLRKYGSVPHAGFGLGFERLIMLCTSVENIRDTIPFPRYPGHCDF